MFSFDSYEEGVEAGIERGQHLLLMQLLTQRLGTLIFNIKTFEDLNKYFL